MKLSELRQIIKEEITEYYKPKINKEKETITFVNDADTKKMLKQLKAKNINAKSSGKTIRFINTNDFKKAQSMLSEAVRVETDKYKWTHGKLPRGTGGWFFKIGKEEKQFHGKYSEAVKKAKEIAKKKGLTSIEVMT